MGARADLMAVADELASAARRNLDSDDPARWQRMTLLAGRAKVALEAAALAQDIGPGDIDRALGDIQAELEAAGVLAESLELEPAEFLRSTFQVVKAWRTEALAGARMVEGYEALRELCQGLARDFTAGDTDTSRRLAGRIHAALESAEQAIGPGDAGQ